MPHAVNDDVRIHYEIEGSGLPLILHPGFLGSIEDWDDAGYTSVLRGQYHLVRIDPRGQGRSDAPHDPAAYATRHRVGDILAVLDAEGIDRAHFWGYSMGGGLGFTLGKVAPQRIRSLVLGAASPFHVPLRPGESDEMLYDLRMGMTTLVSRLEAAVPNIWLSDGERERWLASDAEALAAARAQRLKEPYIAEDDLAGIAVDTLLYAGTNDSMASQNTLEGVARVMPCAEIVVLEGLDHAQTLARSDLVLPHVLAFLTLSDSNDDSRR